MAADNCSSYLPDAMDKLMAADNSSSYLPDAMDKLWFHQNILFFKPMGHSLQSMLTGARSISTTPLPEKSSLSKSSDENKNKQSAYKEKRPARLNIVVDQPLFQLQPPPRSNIRSQSSSPSMNTDRHPKSRRTPKKVRSYKSMSELENYELKGFMDLGFVFPREKLSPHMMSMVPGLQRLRDKDGRGQEDKREVDEGRVRRPYLSEAWFINRPDSPLLNLQMLPKTPDGADVKKHLRFWARKVALLVHEES